MTILHADPCELSERDGEVYYNGEVIDLAYRDYAVWDLLDLRREGTDVGPMLTLFQQNRIISSISAGRKSGQEAEMPPPTTTSGSTSAHA